MRNIAAYIEEARGTCTAGRHLVLSEFEFLFDRFYSHGKPYPGDADTLSLAAASFYFGFAVGMRQQKAATKRKPAARM